MDDATINLRIIDADAFTSLADLLERMEDGDVWSVELASEELRSIMERLMVKTVGEP